MLAGFPPLGLGWFVAVSAGLFALGTYGLLTQRSGIRLLMSVELMLNAANVNFAAVSSDRGTSMGYAAALISIGLAAAEAAVGLAILVHLYRLSSSVETDKARTLRW